MKYGKQYFTRGNYSNYLERKFGALAQDIARELRLEPGQKLIDYGCGYGGLLFELHKMGFCNCFGTDISNWAVEYGRGVFPEIADRLHYYDRNLLCGGKEHLLLLDVLEHMPEYEAEFVLNLGGDGLAGFLLARIPVSAAEGETYVLDVSNSDATHITCHCRSWWLDLFSHMGYEFLGDVAREAIYSSAGVLSGKWRSGCGLT